MQTYYDETSHKLSQSQNSTFFTSCNRKKNSVFCQPRRGRWRFHMRKTFPIWRNEARATKLIRKYKLRLSKNMLCFQLQSCRKVKGWRNNFRNQWRSQKYKLGAVRLLFLPSPFLHLSPLICALGSS